MIELLLALVVLLHVEILWLVWRQHRKGHVPKSSSNPVYVDTSSLMDGRIIAALSSGFMPQNIVIPRSVLAELQLLADGSDSDKRSKARHGLDVARQLREDSFIHTTVFDDGDAEKGVDEQLLQLARTHKGAICTVDYNLAKVAQVESIKVLNINELAQQLRMNYLPGEKVSLKITQKGNDNHQGVGYLADGTMVVVEQAQPDVGKTVEVEFIRSLQTMAGRMMFAKKMTTKHEVKKAGASRQKPTARRPRTQKSAEASLVELANKSD